MVQQIESEKTYMTEVWMLITKTIDKDELLGISYADYIAKTFSGKSSLSFEPLGEADVEDTNESKLRALRGFLRNVGIEHWMSVDDRLNMPLVMAPSDVGLHVIGLPPVKHLTWEKLAHDFKHLGIDFTELRDRYETVYDWVIEPLKKGF